MARSKSEGMAGVVLECVLLPLLPHTADAQPAFLLLDGLLNGRCMATVF